jgi:hypothetical protein
LRVNYVGVIRFGVAAYIDGVSEIKKKLII